MKIVFISKNGDEFPFNFSAGQTILNVLEEASVQIKSTCEGFGVCGSCHIIIENLYDKLPPISDRENDALDNARGVTIKSRLACQIILNESLNGLRIRIP